MKIGHKVSFPGGRDFEQHTAYFEITDEDIAKEAVGSLNLIEKMFVFNTVVLYEGILFQHTKGYITAEEFKAQKERIFGMLNEKLMASFKAMLKGS